MKLAGKTVMVTGASRNIGKAIALRFAEEGADLVLNTRLNEGELLDVVAECERHGSKVLPVLADVSIEECAVAAVDAALRRFGKIDVLVINHGIRPHTPLLELTSSEWRQVFDVNLHSAFYLCTAALPSMVERRSGNIVVLGGGYAPNIGLVDTAAVTASKLALEGLIRVIAGGLGSKGIRANVLMPGSIDTERRYPDWYPEYEGRDEEREVSPGGFRIPLQRQGTPEEMAAACLFLASDESSYITGSPLWVTGGLFAR